MSLKTAVLICSCFAASSAGAPDEASPPGQHYRALVEEFERGRRDFLAALRKAKGPAEGEAVIAEERPDEAKFIARFLDLARSDPTGPIAAEAATWILTHTPYAPDPGAVEIVDRHHVASAVIGPICLAIGFSTTRANGDLLRRILRENPHPDVRGKACLGLAQHDLFLGNRAPQEASDADPARSLALQAEAASLLERAIADHGGADGDTTALGASARQMLAEIRRFGIGRVAPELEGRDVDGMPFRLAESRGKVVVLTFSGDWCGPCKGMYPDERGLVDRYKGRDLAILGVSTDEKPDTLRKSIEARAITWRCWWDGGMDGPICKAWEIRQYPTIYVLDPAGVIRYKGVQRADLTKSVELLMKESGK